MEIYDLNVQNSMNLNEICSLILNYWFPNFFYVRTLPLSPVSTTLNLRKFRCNHYRFDENSLHIRIT